MKKELQTMLVTLLLIVVSVVIIPKFAFIVGCVAISGYVMLSTAIIIRLVIVVWVIFTNRDILYFSKYNIKLRIENIGWNKVTFWHNDPAQTIIYSNLLMGVETEIRYNPEWAKRRLHKVIIKNPSFDDVYSVMKMMYETYMMAATYRVSEPWILKGKDEDRQVNGGVFNRLLSGIENISGDRFPNIRNIIENYSLEKEKK